MIFSKNMVFGLAASMMLAACGGSQEPAAPAPQAAVPEAAPATPSAENIVENPVVEEASETENPFAALPEPYQSADYNVGRRTFRQCGTCHSLVEGGPHLLGPNLYGIFARQVGSVESFGAYSKASKEADFSWTPELLDEWLANPNDFLPGNSMSFAGLRRPTDRTAVIAYIMVETGYVTSE
ncbi:MAG: cytochrome c family protein [Pseudomonadota bacterium]